MLKNKTYLSGCLTDYCRSNSFTKIWINSQLFWARPANWRHLC